MPVAAAAAEGTRASRRAGGGETPWVQKALTDAAPNSNNACPTQSERARLRRSHARMCQVLPASASPRVLLLQATCAAPASIPLRHPVRVSEQGPRALAYTIAY